MKNVMELVQIEPALRTPAPKPMAEGARPGGRELPRTEAPGAVAGLNTVCESAHCPNIGECWHHQTATFMMLGNLCTRRCGFCAVPKGRPRAIDFDEPRRVAAQVAQLGLLHAVVTSVIATTTCWEGRELCPGHRRDSPPGAQLPRRGTHPRLSGDGRRSAPVVAAQPEVLNHNVESVPRLYRVVRSGSAVSAFA